MSIIGLKELLNMRDIRYAILYTDLQNITDVKEVREMTASSTYSFIMN
ncbi:hypothetical protein SAMN05444487_10816 [Marininema mesophilum]|uniref:Uncharacterized protein n=1 Tax=Marininema mesophilum TaxID=1048340 RepID=A0A1H2XQ87_9BACL|nr:hypothetical protein SAMN05444487_10816 [Marininema mesophilum]